ncbi:bifunctional metallophosphatase/5'-nucleotidase [Rhodobium gokarnense]|uniref:2',3'-cyclic-nucleotide 2'-phosphodiesterase (5'-nucleotidase family) n=1 Tax=Rhodobium gokarnense TaxID=364296 RepID=A0ABT3H6P1_9HYPH|nr:bifunctional UDP-sugar hydrolase/5'-nucleotidase [Rhodobium gokarnense]MCW2306063.1 2',3'-cyclic-nucleotide 2'-phosphodiesterase (5'-nucleotidase family) [Rhodobium gokarnense]
MGKPTNALAALVAAMLFLAASVAANAAEITFVLVNDIDTIEHTEERGGFARLATVVKAERAARKNVIFVHAGDSLSPSLLSGLDKGAHIVDLLNMTPPDVFVPGNHEFDFGKDVFLTRLGEMKFPKFAANLRLQDGSPVPGVSDSRLLEVDGVKIGIIGVTSADARDKSSPGDLVFEEAMKTAFAERRKLKEKGADLFVVVGHLGRGEDLALYRSGAFDLILSGDDHDLYLQYDGRTAIAESRHNARFVTAVDLDVTVSSRGNRRRVDWRPNFRIVDTASIAPDAAVAARIAEYEKRLSEELDVAIGTTAGDLDSRRAAVRSGEAAIGNLIADAMRHAVAADIALTNGGGIRGDRVYAAGTPLTRRDILSELPFANHTVLLEVSGKTVKAALEHGVSQIDEGSGRFPQVSGIRFSLDPAKPQGSRISDIVVGDAPLDLERTYRLATNDFMARGGDGYRMLKRAKPLIGPRHSGLLANDVMAYIREKGEISPKIEKRIYTP